MGAEFSLSILGQLDFAGDWWNGSSLCFHSARCRRVVPAVRELPSPAAERQGPSRGFDWGFFV